MIGLIFRIISFFLFRIPFYVIFNRTTWLIFFLLLVGVGIFVAYKRIYFSFKRVKVEAKKTVLVTGGSGGIGFSLAKLFVEDQYNVIIAARNLEKLNKARDDLQKEATHEKQYVEAWQCDLSSDDGPKEMFERLQSESIHIDILVNNAGFGGMGYFVDLVNSETSMIMTNCAGLVNLTKYLLPEMIKSKKGGYVLNVASMAGFAPQVFSATYGATKAFVRSFSVALNTELQEHKNVSVTILSPGLTKTGFGDIALEGLDVSEDDVVKKFGMAIQSADDCAFEGYRAMFKREVEVVSGLSNFLMSKFMLDLLPTWINQKISYSMMKKGLFDEEEKKKL